MRCEYQTSWLLCCILCMCIKYLVILKNRQIIIAHYSNITTSPNCIHWVFFVAETHIFCLFNFFLLLLPVVSCMLYSMQWAPPNFKWVFFQNFSYYLAVSHRTFSHSFIIFLFSSNSSGGWCKRRMAIYYQSVVMTKI